MSNSINNNDLPTGTVAALFVGKPENRIDASGKKWRSAIVKDEVPTRIFLDRENFAGDYQADRKHHGGPDKAVCGYFAAHYPHWQTFLNDDTFGCGAFGENITIDGFAEENLCVGDTLRLGDALCQVSQPRQPCANISRRWDNTKLPIAMEANGATGFYLRVLETGNVGVGDPFTIVERPYPAWTILRCNEVIYAKPSDVALMTELRDLPLLSAEWKRILGRKLGIAD